MKADFLGYNSSLIENGKKWPRPNTLMRITKVLGVKVVDLFEEGESKSKAKDKSLDRWIERFRFLLKGKNEKDIKTIYDFFKKLGKDT